MSRQVVMVVIRLDTLKSGWTSYVYLTQRQDSSYRTIFVNSLSMSLRKIGNQSKRQLCREKS